MKFPTVVYARRRDIHVMANLVSDRRPNVMCTPILVIEEISFISKFCKLVLLYSRDGKSPEEDGEGAS